MKGVVPVLALALLAFLPAREAAAGEVVRFGVVPQQSAQELAKSWLPILAYLQQKTGLRLAFETAKDIPTFEQRLAAGEYDIAYMNPFHYVVFHAAQGYEAFAREKGAKLQGLIVVRRDSGIKDIAELSGASVVFPAPLAFAATILPLAHFKNLGIAVTPHFAASHDSVYLAVIKGFFPAGGGIRRTFDNLKPEIKDQLRVLWKTPEYTPHPLAAHPRFPKPDLARLSAAMLDMDDSPEGRELLARLGIKGFEAGGDADYADVRGLGISVIENVGKDVSGQR
jgi:phosphonate transport system substrate-binding protein